MASKIKLGSRPKNFKRKITVPMLDGSTGAIEVSYLYRTRSEFGAFIDELFESGGVKPASASEEDVRFSLKSVLDQSRDKNADYILKIVDGWDLDEDFGRAAVVQLCDELPGAALAIIEQYRTAITEGRLGN